MCVPVVVVACVREIEERGMDKVGLYRVIGNDMEVRKLSTNLSEGNVINLATVEDVNVIASALKEFLTGLEEPVATLTQYHSFLEASSKLCDDDARRSLCKCISRLPEVNRHTLAYIIIHLQKVSASTHIKMGIHMLARMFGPVLIGFGATDVVVKKLMRIQEDYWTNILTKL